MLWSNTGCALEGEIARTSGQNLIMEPEFPLEFIVPAAPVSFQRQKSGPKQAWKELVRASVSPLLPEMHFATKQRLSVTLYYYPENEMVGDLDNVVKLTLDAMSQHVYVNDYQIDRIVIQKFESGRVFPFTDPSPTLANCILGQKPALYVKLSNDLHEELRR